MITVLVILVALVLFIFADTADSHGN